jgi:hypothetical protein
VKFALGVMFLWSGAACLYLASHGIEATTPWGAWRTLLTQIGQSNDATTP